MYQKPELQLVLFGTGGCGKSALVQQYLYSYFLDDYDPTIEEIYELEIEKGSEMVKFKILDTAGSEEYEIMYPNYIKSSQGFILVYSICKRSTFDAVLKYREKILDLKEPEDFRIMLVGNKKDLESERKVSYEEGLNSAESLGARFFETSAFTKENVDQIFQEGLRMILTIPKKIPDCDGMNKKKWLKKQLLPRDFKKKEEEPLQPTAHKPQSLFVSDLKKILQKSKIYDYSIICEEKGTQENQTTTSNQIYLHKWILKKRLPEMYHLLKKIQKKKKVNNNENFSIFQLADQKNKNKIGNKNQKGNEKEKEIEKIEEKEIVHSKKLQQKKNKKRTLKKNQQKEIIVKEKEKEKESKEEEKKKEKEEEDESGKSMENTEEKEGEKKLFEKKKKKKKKYKLKKEINFLYFKAFCQYIYCGTFDKIKDFVLKEPICNELIKIGNIFNCNHFKEFINQSKNAFVLKRDSIVQIPNQKIIIVQENSINKCKNDFLNIYQNQSNCNFSIIIPNNKILKSQLINLTKKSQDMEGKERKSKRRKGEQKKNNSIIGGNEKNNVSQNKNVGNGNNNNNNNNNNDNINKTNNNNNKIFNLHKSILIKKSKYFKTLFHINLFQENQTDTLTLENISRKSFEILIKFLYCDDLQMIQKSENQKKDDQFEFETSLKRIIKIYKLSDYFQIKVLGDTCILKISELINLDNVDQIFYYATQHNIQILIERCQWFYGQNYKIFKKNKKLKKFLNQEVIKGVEKYVYPSIKCSSLQKKLRYKLTKKLGYV
ncbi:ras-like protein [Anaeramoeba flamelloides]|uniref:Ras-like protein n=1 Tax=Anaeramoeba flamelloides TaxID=1746091 RepID=A0ABQ8YFB8_9EUKA|nr:ras-like protein [Anaeramoeba flamelloides]